MLLVNLQIQQLEVHVSIMQNGMLVTSILHCQGLRLAHNISPLHLLSQWLINKLRPREGSHLCTTCMKSEFNAGHRSHLFHCFPRAHYCSDHLFVYFLSFFPLSFSFSLSFSASTSSFGFFVCLANMMDGPISPPAVNEAERLWCWLYSNITARGLPRPANDHYAAISRSVYQRAVIQHLQI